MNNYTHLLSDAQMAELRAHVASSPRRRIVRVTINDAPDEVVEAMARAQIAAEVERRHKATIGEFLVFSPIDETAEQTQEVQPKPLLPARRRFPPVQRVAPKRGRPPSAVKAAMTPAERDAAKREQCRQSMARMRAARKADAARLCQAEAPETALVSMVAAAPMPPPSSLPPGVIPPYADIRSGTCWWRPRP